MPSLIAEMPQKICGTWIRERKYSDDLLLEWCDGQARKFTQGEDFTCKPSGFLSYMRRRALDLGFKSTGRVRGKHAFFQVTEKIPASK